MRGIDKPTGRVVVLLLLLIVVAAALHGYVPARSSATHAEGSSRAALWFVVAALSATIALMAIAVIARLRDPRAVAPTAGEMSEMTGGGIGRPNWRVVLIGLAVLMAWLLIALSLTRVFTPHDVDLTPPTPEPGAPRSAQPTAPPPKQQPPKENRDVLTILLASGVPMILTVVAGAAVASRRRFRSAKPAVIADEGVESPAPAGHSESLVRAAELGLAEMADLGRDPREAIIACYAAMERELANVPGAVPQDFDTPTEVLARAVELHALHADNAVQLVNLFEEARFSPHVMNEGHREVAVRVLQLVLDELAPQSRGSAV
jgi:hypothetical protein